MKIIDKLYETHNLTEDDMLHVLQTDIYDEYIFSKADEMRRKIYGNKVYIRGLIEFTNCCKNDCFYCGLRKSNQNIKRYRLSKEQIIDCCKTGYSLGFRTFVLQGGEDGFFSDDILCDIVSGIKKLFDDCAVTLSVGERSFESYKALYDAGANRYLLRHETASAAHYNKLHPAYMSIENRKRCLFDLKKIGYETGAGFMVQSPFQTVENIVEDLKFLKQLNPQMIGIGPYIPHNDTPFREFKSGSLILTLRLIGILRLMFPYALIPATTALATIDKAGREKALKCGANVVMPNLSPISVRKQYSIYNDKAAFGNEDALKIERLKENVKSIGYEVVCDIGSAKRAERI